jgi:hypothetical protein
MNGVVSMTRPVGTPPIDNRALWRFFVTLALGATVLQLYIALVAANEITIGAYLVLAAIGLYYFLFRASHATQLRQRPFGDYFAHVGGYIVINGSFWIHAALLVATGNRELIDSNWAGLLFGMSVLWGIGVLLHTIGAVLDKGYENVHV